MSAGLDWDAIVDQWLAKEHKALIQELAANLDLEAGLHDAMIPARHAALLADLRETLDLESGLGAIVPGSIEGILKRDDDDDKARVLQRPSSLRELIRRLSSNSPRDLLEFRTHTIWSEGIRPRRCGCLEICTIITDLVSAEIRTIEEALDGNRDRPSRTADTEVVAQKLLGQLRALLDRTRQFDQTFNTDLNELRKTVDKLVRMLDTSNALQPARDVSQSLKDDLDKLDHVLNDFTGVDLRNTNLQGVQLDGVRWSAETQWPSGWADEIRSKSIEVAPGIFAIHIGRPRGKRPTRRRKTGPGKD